MSLVKKNMLVGFFLLIGFLKNSVYAQDELALSRVREVEIALKSDISEFVEKYVPSNSFSVQVKIDPLRRSSSEKNYKVLPYYEDQDITQEEWDDPNSSYFVLINRVRSIKVDIIFDTSYSLKNEPEFRELILKSFNLVPGRDSVEFKLSSFKPFEKNINFKEINWTYVLIGLFIISFSILFFFFFSKLVNLSTKGIAELENSKSVQQNAGSVNNDGIQLSSSLERGNRARLKQGSINTDDFAFTDSLRLGELVTEKIKLLYSENYFVRLSDMIVLDNLAKEDPSGFCYLLSQFSSTLKNYIYSNGKDLEWVKAFTARGSVTKNVLAVIEQLLYAKNESKSNQKFEELLIVSWRLQGQLDSLIKSLAKDEAKCILYHLPRSLSLDVARNVFPGDWAFLFSEQEIKFKKMNDIRLQEIISKAISIKARYDENLVITFKHQEELLIYLHGCSPEVERDIYLSYQGTPALNEMRKPFYVFFEMDRAIKEKVFKRLDLKTWALACFNVSREYRSRVDELMNDKELYIFKSILTDLDKLRPSTDVVAEARSLVANLVYDFDIKLIKKENTVGETRNAA